MKTHKLDIWRVADLWLKDQKDFIPNNDFNYLHGCIRARSLDGLLSFAPDASTSLAYITYAQLMAFFKKNADFTSKECEASTYRNFHKAETLCRIANRRLRYCAEHPDRDRFFSIKEKIRHDLSALFGDIRNFIRSVPDRVRVTSGATENTVRKDSLPYLKVRKVVSCTHGAIPLVRSLALHLTGMEPKYRTTDFNRVVFVPKNYKIMRSIAAEPQGNLPFQLAVDSYLKDRLRTVFGIDLSSQRRNQQLALEGSLTGSYATIDLSMASDTMSREVVRQLIPRKWYKLLTSLRSPCYRLPNGDIGEYEKYSSMGNGYTFTLETAIFAAVARLYSTTSSVYGDDIIVESPAASDVIATLRHLGFYTNSEKTFVDGPFRESCGCDYWNGISVRPFYIRSTDSDDLCALAHNLNGIFKIGKPYGLLWQYARKIVQLNRIPIVPHLAASNSGVRVPFQVCVDHKIVTHKNSMSFCKMLYPSAVTKPIRALHGVKAMWFSIWMSSRHKGRELPLETSGPIDHIRVRRRSLPVPNRVEIVDIHLFCLGEFLVQHE